MKKTLLIVIGLCLLLGGSGYAGWWWTAIGQARNLMTAGTVQDMEGSPQQYGRLVKAFSIIGVDPFAPASQGSAESPEKLARKISRLLYTHMVMGILASLAGFVIVIVGVSLPARK